jgi:alginate O-acetyltransferase complex protein AlgI
MLFSSITFLYYFLPVVICLYFAIPKEKIQWRNVLLLIASLVFYSWGEPVYVFLMIYSIFFNYFMAFQIKREQRQGGTGRRNLVFTIIMNLCILGFFKYFGFFMDTLNSVLGTNIHYTALSLPIGISFYTFQALSYIFDVYHDKVKPQSNLIKFALYLALFPQLIAGPIVKYRDISEQLDERHTDLEGIGDGAVRFIFGLGKKVLLANAFGELHKTVLGLSTDNISIVIYWVGMIAYTMQIYFDFSGYSDMAIGLGRIFGFRFQENFKYPYISRTITEFWRRWHISLSSWFREYLYIPLGGNRVSVPRHMLNLMIVWGLTGLWHGASWNFVAWGLYYGIILILEKYVYGKYLENAPSWTRHLYTMFIVMIGWVFFFSSTLSDAVSYIGIMLGSGPYPLFNTKAAYLLKTNIIMLVIGGFMCTPAPMNKFLVFWRKHTKIAMALIFGVLLLTTAYLIYGSYNPFLYFRF